MRRVYLLAVLIIGLCTSAEARPAKPRPPGGDVHITISTREQIAVAIIFGTVNPQVTSYDKLRALMTLDQALGLDEGRVWVSEWLKVNAKDVEAWRKVNPRGELFLAPLAPDEPKSKFLTRVEAEALVDALAIKPTKEHPIALALGRIIVDVHDAVADALAAVNAPKPKAPVAKK